MKVIFSDSWLLHFGLGVVVEFLALTDIIRFFLSTAHVGKVVERNSMEGKVGGAVAVERARQMARGRGAVPKADPQGLHGMCVAFLNDDRTA